MTPERFQKIKNILINRQPDLTVVMDNVHKPHNLAAIIRSCDSVGIGDIYCVSKHENIGVNLKPASGANHWVNLHIQASIQSTILTLKKKSFSIYAANNSTSAMDFRKIDYTKPTAIVLGAELDGQSQETLENVDGEINRVGFGMVKIVIRTEWHTAIGSNNQTTDFSIHSVKNLVNEHNLVAAV